MSTYTDFLLTLLTIVLGILTIINFVNGRKKDGKSEGVQTGTIEQKLDGVAERIDEIRVDVKELRLSSVETGKELSAVHESAKSAHKRIDQLENQFQSIINNRLVG